MRWLAWLFLCTPCMAGYGGPLPEMPVGTREQTVVIQGPPREPDGGSAQTFLVGVVVEVSAEVDRKPQRIQLSESCVLKVESAFGYLNEIAGVKTAQLQESHEQSPYEPVQEDWGRLWHYKKGQRLLVILHRSERELCFVPEELVLLDERVAALPQILHRTALLPEEFADADLAVLQQASPFLHRRFLSCLSGDRATSSELARLRRESLLAMAGYAALVVLGILTICKVSGRSGIISRPGAER